MSLNIPNTFIGGVGQKARASEVNANFQAVAAKFTEGAGGIADGDISAVAGIKGTKISNVAGNRIPTDRIEDDAIDQTKLRDDATAGSPNAAVNTANHIRDGIITALKILAGSLSGQQLKVTTVTQAFSVVVAGSNQARGFTITPGVALPLMSALSLYSCSIEGVNANTEAVAGLRDTGAATVYTLMVSNTAPTTCTGTIRLRYLAATP